MSSRRKRTDRSQLSHLRSLAGHFDPRLHYGFFLFAHKARTTVCSLLAQKRAGTEAAIRSAAPFENPQTYPLANETTAEAIPATANTPAMATILVNHRFRWNLQGIT